MEQQLRAQLLKEQQLRIDTQKALSEALNGNNTTVLRAKEVLSADVATFLRRVVDYSKVVAKFAQDLLDIHEAFCKEDEAEGKKRKSTSANEPVKKNKTNANDSGDFFIIVLNVF